MKPFFKSITKHGVVLVILLLVAAVALQVTHLIFPGFISSVFEPPSLDAAQVEALREMYPEMPRVYEPTVGVNPFNMQRFVKKYWHAYVLAEVVNLLDNTSRSLTLSHEEVVGPTTTEKEKALGLSLPDHQINQVVQDYRIRILDILYQGDVSIALDPDLALSVGQEIEIRSCVSNKGVCESPLPNVQPGGLFFIGIPIIRQEFWSPSGYHFTSDGLYYVVDGTHVISAYPEREPYVYSGLTLPAFKRIIQEIRNTPTEMDDQARKSREIDPNPTGA